MKSYDHTHRKCHCPGVSELLILWQIVPRIHLVYVILHFDILYQINLVENIKNECIKIKKVCNTYRYLAK